MSGILPKWALGTAEFHTTKFFTRVDEGNEEGFPYRNTTDPAKQAQFATYLQGYSNATSPDPRYVKSPAALAEDAKKVSDWCGKNGTRTYGEAVATIVGPASSGAGAPAAAAAPAAPPPPPEPTSCKVGATKGCAGCSVTCTGGAQAQCNEPRDSGIKDDQGNPECAMPAWCLPPHLSNYLRIKHILPTEEMLLVGDDTQARFSQFCGKVVCP